MTMTSSPLTVGVIGDTQILIEREFAAPKHLVYRAWTEPEYVRRWWHAGRGVVTVCEIDLRVGGKWRYVSEVTGYGEVGFHGEYREVVENERLVTTEAFEGIPDADANASINTLTLTEVGGRTKMTVLVDHATQEGRDMHIASGMEAGLGDALDLLEGLLTEAA